MKLTVNEFNLTNTIESGQFFRYKKANDKYICQERDKIFWIKQTNSTLEFKGTSKKYIRHLFGLTTEQDNKLTQLKNDKSLNVAMQKYPGLRIMQRDPFETLISFQCSIMSNIKKIQLNMEKLAQTFGEQKEFEGTIYNTFPKPGSINNLDKIKNCSTGFRAKWIYASNKMINDKSLARLKKINYEDAKEELMTIPGIAKKVADCICLFSLEKHQAFPVDVWIARVMNSKYFKEEQQHDVIRSFAAKRWGANAGLAQQYLYHWSRNA